MSDKKGRPQGSKNITETQPVQTPTCPACGCTDRTRYRFVSSTNHPGYTSQGNEYSHVVRRRTSCTKCHQVRIDKFFENRAPAKDPGDEDEPT